MVDDRPGLGFGFAAGPAAPGGALASRVRSRRERSMTDHVYKIELVGSSPDSIEDAIRIAISRADRTRNLRWFEVVQTRGHVEKGEVRHFQVVLKAVHPGRRVSATPRTIAGRSGGAFRRRLPRPWRHPRTAREIRGSGADKGASRGLRSSRSARPSGQPAVPIRRGCGRSRRSFSTG